MEAERDYLQRIIIPELNEYFAPQRVLLNVVDLRWGVKTNDLEVSEEREEFVLKVCLNEIKRSRPFFIAILGDRYGWIPPVGRFRTIYDSLSESERNLLSYGENKSVTELEILFGALKAQIPVSHYLFYYRSEASYQNMDACVATKYRDALTTLAQVEKTERTKLLAQLKSDICDFCAREGLTDSIHEYTLNWQNGHFEGLEEWGCLVKEQLCQEIQRELHVQESDDASGWSWYADEEHALSSFVAAHAQKFEGRKTLLASLKSFAYSQQDFDAKVKILTAFSGAGKSAVMCRLYVELMQEADDHTILLFGSAGITSISTNIVSILQCWSRRLCTELGIEYSEEAEFMHEQEPWAERVRKQFLYLAQLVNAKGKRLVILLDSLDSFAFAPMLVHFTFLPEDAITITTTLPRDLSEYQRLGFEVEDMETFSVADATSMIQAVCRMHYKDLHQSVLCKLLEKRQKKYFAHSSPLWLSLATQILFSLDTDDFEAIRQRNEENNEDKIEQYLCSLIDSFPVDAGELFLFLVDKAANYFGETLTQQSLEYIAASKSGLREKDLFALLGDQWDELKFASLRRWFGGLIREQGDDKRWNFTHNLLCKVLDNGIAVHRRITTYLLSLPESDPLRMEIMYHQLKGNDRKGVATYYAGLVGNALLQASEDLAEFILLGEEQKKWVITMLDQNIEEKALLQQHIRDSLVGALNARGGMEDSMALIRHYFEQIEKKEELSREEANEAYLMHKLLFDISRNSGGILSMLPSNYIAVFSIITKTDLSENPPLQVYIKQFLVHLKLYAWNFDKLSDSIMEYYNLAKELKDSNPENEQAVLLFMDAFYCMGELGRRKEAWDSALNNYIPYAKYLDYYQQNLLKDRRYLVDLIQAYSKIARLSLSKKNDVVTAKTYADQCVSLSAKLYAEDARNIEWVYGLAEGHLILGDCALTEGNIDAVMEQWNVAAKYTKRIATVTATKYAILIIRSERNLLSMKIIDDYEAGLKDYEIFFLMITIKMRQFIDPDLYLLVVEILEGWVTFFQENQLYRKAVTCSMLLSACYQGLFTRTKQRKFLSKGKQVSENRKELKALKIREKLAKSYLRQLKAANELLPEDLAETYKSCNDLLDIERLVLAIFFLRTGLSEKAEEELASLYKQEDIFVPLQMLCLKNLLYCLLLHAKWDEFGELYEELSENERADSEIEQLYRIFVEKREPTEIECYCRISF